MRFAIAAIVAAALAASPAAAQDYNEVNTAVPSNVAENAVGNVAVEPAMPMDAPVTTAPVDEAVVTPETERADGRDAGFPWGLIGLIGLLGLLGRSRG